MESKTVVRATTPRHGRASAFSVPLRLHILSGKWFDLSALEGPCIVSGQPEIGFGTIDPERTASPKDRHPGG